MHLKGASSLRPCTCVQPLSPPRHCPIGRGWFLCLRTGPQKTRMTVAMSTARVNLKIRNPCSHKKTRRFVQKPPGQTCSCIHCRVVRSHLPENPIPVLIRRVPDARQMSAEYQGHNVQTSMCETTGGGGFSVFLTTEGSLLLPWLSTLNSGAKHRPCTCAQGPPALVQVTRAKNLPPALCLCTAPTIEAR